MNKNGGLYIKEYGKKLPIKLIVSDDESDPGKAAAAVEKLIKVHKVDLMLSTHSTPLVIPSCVTAEKYKRYYHSTACLVPVWGGQKFKWSTMFFIDMPTFPDSLYKVMDVVPGKIKRPAMLMEDTLDGRGLGGVLSGGAEPAGYKLVVNEPWAVGAKDYSSQILKLIIADDESNAGKAGKAVERLIKLNKVDMLLGGFAAPFGVIPGCLAAEKFKRYYHTSLSLVPPWLEKNFKWSTLYFFDLEQAVSVPYQIWEKMPEIVRPKKPALLMEDTFDGRAFAGLFRAIGEKFGHKFVLDEPLAVGSKDYSAQIIKAKRLGVDSILIFTSDSDSVTFVRQMKEMNFSASYLHGWKGTWAGEFWDALDGGAQYILSDGFWSMDFPFEGAKELGERYYKDFGKYSVSVGATYALSQILFHAIEKAGTLDGAKVRQAVLSNKFKTVMGPVEYDDNGVALFTSTAHQWWDGKQRTIYPFDLAKWKTKLAPPWNER